MKWMYSRYITNGMFAGFAGNCLKSEDGWRLQKSTCLGCDQAEKPWISDLFDISFCHVASKRASWGFAGMVCKTEWVMMSGCIVSAFCPGIHATILLCYASHMSCLCEVRTWFFLPLCAGFRATCSSQGSISISFTAPHWRCTSRRKRATPSILWDFWPSARAVVSSMACRKLQAFGSILRTAAVVVVAAVCGCVWQRRFEVEVVTTNLLP